MIQKNFFLIVLVSIVLTSCKKEAATVSPVQTTAPLKYEIVQIQTTYGKIAIWLYDKTPLHKNNFLKLTKAHFYDSLIFHRVIPNFVIQGGDPNGDGSGGPDYKIKAEFDSSLTHVLGAVAAARDNNPEKQSHGSQFYIVNNVNGDHNLDMNYTVFGQVIGGMDEIMAISKLPTDSIYNKPLQNVYMTKVDTLLLTATQLLNTYNFTVR